MDYDALIIVNHRNTSWDDETTDGPPLHTRIIFASAWILIAVAGILGKQESRIDYFVCAKMSS